MFLESSVTVRFRDVGTIEQVINWTLGLLFRRHRSVAEFS